MAADNSRPAKRSKQVTLTEAQLQEIVTEAAENATRRILRDMGIPEGKAEAMEMRRDFTFLREWRHLCDLSRRRGVVVMVTMTISTVLALLVGGIYQFFTKGQ